MVALLCLLALALAPTLLIPGWGPGTHIQLTRRLLSRLRAIRRLRPPQAIALEYADSFLYGNIAADIIHFKAFGGAKNHCHNWNIHERLESLTRANHAQAFILGYLCHLAADIVAHNHLIPYHMVHGLPPRILAHPYWEALADAAVSDSEWHEIDRLKESSIIHSYDELVHRAVRLRVLGLRGNRWIFNNLLLASCRRSWREFIRSVRDQAPLHPLDEAFLARCREHAYANMWAVFYPRRLALLKTGDPTGRLSLRGARALRRQLLLDFGRTREGRRRARAASRVLAEQAFGLPSLLREHT